VHEPGTSATKGAGMLLTAAIILVLGLLLYRVWDWLWHIVTALAVALLLYLLWPDDLVKSWLQQIQLPQASATRTSSAPPYVPPRPMDESRLHFEGLGQADYPRPHPRPLPCGEDRAGRDVFIWRGRRWYLSRNEQPYGYLCVPEKRLEWCWPIPPNASAVPCRSSDTGEDGWCW